MKNDVPVAVHYLNVFGYLMGAVYPPTWTGGPLIRKDDPQVLKSGMVFFHAYVNGQSRKETYHGTGRTSNRT